MPVTAPHTHLCFVSQQVAANLLPLLDRDFAPKRVLLFVTPQMSESARSLEEAIKLLPYPIKCERVPLVNAYDVEVLEDLLLTLVEKLDKGTAVNLTGGTKLMSLVAQRVAQLAEFDSFYLQHDTGEVLYFGADVRGVRKIPLRFANPLLPYLRAYGFRAEKTTRGMPFTKELLALSEELVRSDSFAKQVPTLNYLASSARETLCADGRDLDRDPALAALADRLVEGDLLSIHGSKIRFTNEETRFFVNGGWLEEYVSDLIRKLRLPGLLVETNLTVEYCEGHESKTNLSGTHNELDVPVWYRNRLYVFECKTIDYGKNDANDALSKLGLLAKRLGSAVQAVLVTFVPLKEKDLQRAKDQKIKVLTRSDLRRGGEVFRALLEE